MIRNLIYMARLYALNDSLVGKAYFVTKAEAEGWIQQNFEDETIGKVFTRGLVLRIEPDVDGWLVCWIKPKLELIEKLREPEPDAEEWEVSYYDMADRLVRTIRADVWDRAGWERELERRNALYMTLNRVIPAAGVVTVAVVINERFALSCEPRSLSREEEERLIERLFLEDAAETKLAKAYRKLREEDMG